MNISHPLSTRYSEEYRRRLFLMFNMFGDGNHIEALRMNVAKFGASISKNPSKSSADSTEELEPSSSAQEDCGE